MKYVYLVTTGDGYYYVGKHSWEGAGKDPSYTGSGKRLHGKTVASCMILEDCTDLSVHEYNIREMFWIRHYAMTVGVVPGIPEALSGNKNALLQYVRGGGRLLNCHASVSPDTGKRVWYIDDNGPYTLKEVMEKTCHGLASYVSKFRKYGSFMWHGKCIHLDGCSGGPEISDPSAVMAKLQSHEIRMKARDTRVHDDTYGSSIKIATASRDEHSFHKGVETRIKNGTWESFHSAGIIAAAECKRRLRPLYTNGEFTGDYEQIAEYIGYSGKTYKAVSAMLRGALPIPEKWKLLKEFTLCQ